MKVAFFSAKPYDRESFDKANSEFGHELVYLDSHLSLATTPLAQGCAAVCAFVNDRLDRSVLARLKTQGVSTIALRCAGYNNVDLTAAKEFGFRVVRVPAYSPHAVAEHALGLMLALDRKLFRAYNRVREGNFSLDGLLGFDLHGKTAGVVGTGAIGTIVARLLLAFGCRVLAADPAPQSALARDGVTYVDLDSLFRESDIVSLHCPLNRSTLHLVDERVVDLMKKGVMLINTGRGGLIDTRAAIKGLKSQKIGYLGLDVYEEESELFFDDLSEKIIQDDVFSRLLTFPNVLITGHQAFFTREAMHAIAHTTLENLRRVEQGAPSDNEV